MKLVQFCINTISSVEALEVLIPYSCYSIASPEPKVCLKNGSKITILLDTDAEINIMIRKLIKDVNLAIKQRPKLELVSHIGYSHPFFGLCKNMKVAIKRLKTRHPISVVEAGNYDLVLGQLFLNSVKFSQEYKPDKIFNIITHLHILQIFIFCTLASQDPANQRENKIFL